MGRERGSSTVNVSKHFGRLKWLFILAVPAKELVETL